MTLRIEGHSSGRVATLRLIGRLRSEELQELQQLIRGAGEQVALDLSQVTLADVDAVRFLARCESDGVELLRCSTYLREWIHRERI